MKKSQECHRKLLTQNRKRRGAVITKCPRRMNMKCGPSKCSNTNLRSLPYPLSDWANEMEQVFDRFLGKPTSSAPAGGRSEDTCVPKLDIAETEKEYHVHVDLPGVKPEDVKIEIHEDRLTIAGRREATQRSEGKNFHRVERRYGEFERTILLPNSVDQDNVGAEFKDGVLEVTIPKVVKSQPKKVEIRSASQN